MSCALTSFAHNSVDGQHKGRNNVIEKACLWWLYIISCVNARLVDQSRHLKVMHA